jgi:glycosyltransferase involved in cell wall biosynthesis
VADQLVFVVRHLPLPADSGAPIRALRLLEGLAREFDCTVVAPAVAADGDPSIAPADLEAAVPGVAVVGVPGPFPSRRRRQLESLAGRASAEFGRGATPALRAAVARAAEGAAVVHYDDVTAGLTGPRPGALNAFAPHNVEHRILADTARHTSGARRAFAGLDGRKLEREERGLWRAMDLCVAVSEVDAAAMREGGAQRIVLCPNGTDAVPRLPAPSRAPGDPLRLLFVGAGSYEPNRRGLEWLLDEVLPKVGLDVRLDAVGTAPGTLPARPGLTLHGKVPSVDPHYAAAHAAVVPILYGSGTRLKVVEAMARGLPVVSTTIGAEGLPVAPGEHYDAADDPEAFAAALRDLAAALEQGTLEPRLARARAAVEPLFWGPVAARLAADYRAALPG